MTNTTGNPVGVGAGTPLPWYVGDEDEGADGVQYVQVHAGRYCDSSFRGIANVEANFDGENFLPLDDETRANAAYIVRACNSFPSLYEALEKIVGHLAADTFHGDVPDECYEAARQALSLARGEGE